MGDQAKTGGAGKLAVAALFVIMFAIPLSRAALQIFPIPPVDVVYFAYHAPILQFLFIIGVWRAGFLDRATAHIPRLPTWLIALVALWLAAGVISAAVSEYPLISMVSEARWFMWVAFAYALLCFFRANPERGAWALDLYVAGFVGFSLVLHFMIFANPDPDYSWVNGIPGFANVRHFGFYAMSALAASLVPLLKRDFDGRSRTGLTQIFAVTMCWTMLFWAGGRSPILSVLVIAAIFAGWRLLPNIGRLAKLSAAAVALAVPWSLVIDVPDKALGLKRLFGSLQLADIEAQSAGRLEIWRGAVERLADVPVFGNGPGVFSQVMADQWGHLLHPHNIVFQALLEWGVLGGLPFLLALAALATGIPRRSSGGSEKSGSGACGDPIALGGALVAFTLLGASFLDGSLYLPFPLMVAAVGGAIYYSRLDYALDHATAPTKSIAGGRLALGAAGAAMLVTGIGAASFVAVRMSGTPPPDGARVAFLRHVPVAMAGAAGILTFSRWTDDWAPDIGSAAVVEQIDWALHYAPGVDLKAALEARRACALGRPEDAERALQVMAGSEFGFFGREQEQIRLTLIALWPACAALPLVPVKRVR